MLCDGREQSVMLGHYPESFFEGCLVVGSGHAFAEVVGEWLFDVEVGHAVLLSLPHTANAPVKVGGKAVLQIIGKGDSAIDVERLMTYEHAVFEGAPGEVLWGGEPTVAKEVPLVVHDVGVTVKDGGSGKSGLCDVGKRFFAVQLVASVEETEKVACGKAKTFVHGVVQPFVGFAVHGGMGVAMGNLHRFVFGSTVDDEVLNMGISLRCDALQGTLKGGLCIIGDSDDAELDGQVVAHGHSGLNGQGRLRKPPDISVPQRFRCRWSSPCCGLVG